MRPRLTYANVVSTLCLFLLLGGGAAYALDGSNTVFTDDISNGEVKVLDIAQGAVTTDEIANGQVKASDIGDGEVRTAEIANGQVLTADIGEGEVRSGDVLNDNLTGGDIATNSLKGADIDEGTLDIGDAARAYARVLRNCDDITGDCQVSQSKGISSVTETETGKYCVIAPGIDAAVTPAVVSIDWNGTEPPEGNAQVFMAESESCGPSGTGFVVFTYLGPDVAVIDAGGNPETVQGASGFSSEVSFTIVIP